MLEVLAVHIFHYYYYYYHYTHYLQNMDLDTPTLYGQVDR